MYWSLGGLVGGSIDARRCWGRTREYDVLRCDHNIAKTGRGVEGMIDPPPYFGC